MNKILRFPRVLPFNFAVVLGLVLGAESAWLDLSHVHEPIWQLVGGGPARQIGTILVYFIDWWSNR